jgi:uncharacterized protein (DUF2235 family)
MAKNIILCSDGTGNADIKGRGTNVFKLFEAVDLNEHRTRPELDAQVAYYDDGVGTGGLTVLRAMGGAAGYGLKRNVKDLYRALSRVYDPGDRIYLFGFSRGAFTVRTLAGLIDTCGVVNGEHCKTAEDLRQAVEAAYVAYRSGYASALTKGVRALLRAGTSDQAIATFQQTHPVHAVVPIEFIGVWDTVDAVGMPFALAGFVNRFLYQFKFPTQALGGNVRRAYHALSIDDDRVAFEPVLWAGPDERLEQVWFSGVHSNVGGGYPKQGMSLVALDWMLGHAELCGLRLHRMDRELFRAHASVDDMLYDARRGVGLFYRWAPRDIRNYCERSRIAPRIHLTVAERIAKGTDDYAPGNIPPDVTVATTPVTESDSDHAFKQMLLDRRAEAVQHVIRKALNGRYLLDEVTTNIAIGEMSYWFFVIAWALFAMGAVNMARALIWPAAGVTLVALAPLLVCVACILLAQTLARAADRTMSRVFSRFWHQHQREIRHTLKATHRLARETSSRIRLSEMRR